jgi:hypothetical protein
VNRNQAPYPSDLAAVVDGLAYRPGWRFRLSDIDRGQGSEGLTFIVTSVGYDTYAPEKGRNYGVYHYFPVPPAAFNRQSWEEWVLDCLLKIESHEACEFLQIDGKRPFAPVHAPGHDPYTVRRVSRIEDAETTYRGERREGSQG